MNTTLFTRQLAMFFETHLPDVKHCSPNTIESYADAFVLLFQYFKDTKALPHYKIDYKNFTLTQVEDFTLWLTKERGSSAASVKQRLSAITSFMKYASRRELSALSAFTAVSGIEKPIVTKSPFPYFTLEEMRILLHLPDLNKKSEKRDFVLLSLLYDSASRAQEMCDLNVGDIKFGSINRLRLLGKGSKVREVPVSPAVADLLRYHLRENEIVGNHNSPLFLSQLGGKMTTACIRHLVGKYISKAKEAYSNLFFEPKYSPHSFRHSRAVHMVESGIPLIYIRNFLGHASVQSSEIYARVGQEKLSKMLIERGKTEQRSDDLVQKTLIDPYPRFLKDARRR